MWGEIIFLLLTFLSLSYLKKNKYIYALQYEHATFAAYKCFKLPVK